MAEFFDKEIKIREAIQMHIDGFVEEMLDKIRNLETKLVQLTENEAALLIHLSKEFRRGAYAIIKGTASAPAEGRPSS